jgi:hypothetical protein
MLRCRSVDRGVVRSFGGVENQSCLVRSRGRSLSRHRRLALTFLRLPSPVNQGRIKARRRPRNLLYSIRPGEKSVSTFPGLQAIADPKKTFASFSVKLLQEHLLRAGIATNYLLKLGAPRLTATYPRPAIRARYCYRPKLMRGSLPGLQCGRVSVPCRAASSASHQGRRERFATSIRRQAR